MTGMTDAAAATRLVGVFDSNERAHVARDALVAAGVEHHHVHLIERPATPAGDDKRAAFLQTLASLFTPAEQPARFHLAEDPNHALVVLDPAAEVDVARAYEVLSASQPVEVYRAV